MTTEERLESLEKELARASRRIDRLLTETAPGLLKDDERPLADGKPEDMGRPFEERGKELRAKPAAQTPNPYRLDDLRAEIVKTPEGLRLGYPSLDKLVAIPQAAVTIVAGRPAHGKTTTLLNLLVNLSRQYEDKTFVFFSYEEQRRRIGLKLLDILSGEVIDPDRNLEALERYWKTGRTDRPKIERGKAELGKLMDSERVLLTDEPYTVEDWTDALTVLSKRLSIGAVFVDYIQKVKIRGRFPTRQAELQRVSEQILETAKNLSLPVILGAQLCRDPACLDKVRLDNLIEAADIEQDASLVLGLHNPALETTQDRGDWLTDQVVDLKVTVLKNRNGPVHEDVMLSFNRPLLTITEPMKSSAS